MTTPSLNPFIWQNSAFAKPPPLPLHHYQLLMNSVHPIVNDSGQNALPALLQNPTNEAALEWRLVAQLDQETQLDQLARCHRCLVHSRTETHVALHCAQMTALRCQFKLLFWRGNCRVFAQGQHNHAQTSPLWELPDNQQNSEKQQQQSSKTSSRRSRTWRLLGLVRINKIFHQKSLQVSDVSQLQRFGTGWKTYGQKRQFWRCPRWPQCRYRMTWYLERGRVYESGKHNHAIDTDATMATPSSSSNAAQNGRPVRRSEQDRSKLTLSLKANEHASTSTSSNIASREQPSTSTQQQVPSNELSNGFVDSQAGGSATPPYGLLVNARQLYEPLTPDGTAAEEQLVGEVSEGSAADAAMMPVLDNDGEEMDLIIIEDSEDDEDGEDEVIAVDDDGQRMDSAMKVEAGQHQQQQQIGQAQGGNGVQIGAAGRGREMAIRNNGRNESGRNNAGIPTNTGNDGTAEHNNQNGMNSGADGNGDGGENGASSNASAVDANANAGQQQQEVGPFRLMDLEEQFSARNTFILSRVEPDTLSDTLLFEDMGAEVRVSEHRERQCLRPDGRLLGRWMRRSEQWGKTSAEQFMLTVRGKCDQMLFSQPQMD